MVAANLLLNDNSREAADGETSEQSPDSCHGVVASGRSVSRSAARSFAARSATRSSTTIRGRSTSASRRGTASQRR